MENISYTSVEMLPGISAKVAFTDKCASVFCEDCDLAPVHVDKDLEYMPWGEDNRMPYDILELIEKDETLSTCQIFNAEVCYGNGLRYNTDGATSEIKTQVEDFLLSNDMSSYFLGVCQDLTYRSSSSLQGIASKLDSALASFVVSSTLGSASPSSSSTRRVSTSSDCIERRLVTAALLR